MQDEFKMEGFADAGFRRLLSQWLKVCKENRPVGEEGGHAVKFGRNAMRNGPEASV